MRPKKSIQELLEQSEDQLFQQIVDEQEGLLGIEESKRLGSPSEEALAQWTARLDKLAAKRSPRRRWKRIAVVAAIIAALLAVSVLAHQVDLLNFVETVQEQFTQLSPTDPPEKTVSAWVGAYCPEYVPEGYMMSDAVDNGDTKAIEYTNSEGVRFTFYQSGGNTISRTDTEAAGRVNCLVGANEGYLVRKSGQTQLLWQTTNAAFCIVFSNTPEEEILKTAESLTNVKEGVAVCATIQLSDTGMSRHCAGQRLNRNTVGVPVIAIGVPTTVRADAILQEDTGDTLLTVSQISTVVKTAAYTIAAAILQAVCPELDEQVAKTLVEHNLVW